MISQPKGRKFYSLMTAENTAPTGTNKKTTLGKAWPGFQQ